MRFIAIVIPAAIVLMLAACGGTTEKPPAPRAADKSIALADPSLKFLTIEPVGAAAEGIAATLPGRLTLRPQAASSVGAPTSGRVVSVLVRPGERVNPGQPLLTMQSADAAAARATLLQAQARAAAAEETLKRQDEMLAKGVGLQLERVEAETRAREARAELERARRAAALLGGGQGDTVSVRAPAPGVVMTLKATVGAMVAPGGDALVEIADTSRLWAVADIAESDAAAIAKGQRVTVRIPATGRQLAGAIDGLGARVEAETRRLPVYVALEGDTTGLAPGMQAELRLAGAREVLSLPVTAVLIKDGKRRVVYIRRPDGRFEARDVRIGASSAGRVVILEGLQPGEPVVVKGALLLDTAAEQLL